MGKKFIEWEVNQLSLLPRSVTDFVPEGHRAHLVRNLVIEELDLTEIYSEYDEERGSPPYDPKMMTGLLLYAYLEGVYASRKVARACVERMDFVALTCQQRPDFRTIASFRQRHLRALGSLFMQVLRLCGEAGLVKLGHVSIDGSKIKANAGKKSSRTYKSLKEEERQLEQEIAGWFEAAEAADKADDEIHGNDKDGTELPEWVSNREERLKRIKAAREKIEKDDEEKKTARNTATETGQKPRSHQKKTDCPPDTARHNFTDPDCAVLSTACGGYMQGYNAQVAVDSDSYVIVSSRVSNSKNDLDELIPTLDDIESKFEKLPAELSADAGYCSEENLRELSERGVRGYVALGKDPSGRAKVIKPGTFAYEMQQKIKKGGKRSRYKIRGRTVEPVFGVIKAARNFRQFLLRGFAKVREEWNLICAVHNMQKLLAARA